MEAIEEVGDTPTLNFDRNRRRNLLGIGFGIEDHENGSFDLVYVLGVVDAYKYGSVMVVDLGRPLEHSRRALMSVDGWQRKWRGMGYGLWNSWSNML